MGHVLTAAADDEVAVQDASSAEADSSSNGTADVYSNGSGRESGSNGSEGSTGQSKQDPWQWDESGDALKVVISPSLYVQFLGAWCWQLCVRSV